MSLAALPRISYWLRAKLHSMSVATENLAEMTEKIFTKIRISDSSGVAGVVRFPTSSGRVPMASLIVVRRTRVAEQCDSRKHLHLAIGNLVNTPHLGQRLDCELSASTT